MRDVDALFDGLRDGVVPHVTGPEPDRIIGRARARRTRHRLVAGGLATAVAAGLFLLPGGTEREAAPVLTPPSPTATTSPAPRERPLRTTDLLYADDAAEAKAEGDPQMRWDVSKEGSDYLAIRLCGETDPFGEEGPLPGALDHRYEITYEGGTNYPDERTAAQHDEQLLVFETEEGARATMEFIIRDAGSCGRDTTIGRPAIGDEAISSDWALDEKDSQYVKGVVARKGRVIVAYGDFRNPAGPELASLDDHERDAREMVEKLASFGY